MSYLNISQLSSVQGVLHTLWQAYQPEAVIHAGIGRGVGELVFWREYQPAQVVMVDAETDRCQWLAAALAQHPNWAMQQCVLADGQAQTFYRASHPDESGLYPLTALDAIWPNLRQASAEVVETVSLDELASSCQLTLNACCCVLDFLPTAAVLAGAAQVLAEARLCVVRVRLDEVSGSAGVAAVSEQLASFGLGLVGVWESNHPSVGYGVWVRQVGVFQAREAALRLAVVGYEQAIQVARDEAGRWQAQLLQAEQQHQIQTTALTLALERAKAEAEQLQHSWESKLLQAEQRLVQTEYDHQTQTTALMLAAEQAKAEAEQLKRDSDGRLLQVQQALAEAKSVADCASSEMAAVKAEAEGYRAERDAMAQELQQLKEKWQETQYRQQLIEEEMIKAEAQLELIKDVLLREPEL